jgi:hypothetical protein
MVTPKLAAQYLAGHLGESAVLWQHRLANWRRPGRCGPLQAKLSEAGYPGYAVADLEIFVTSQRATGAFTALSDGDRPRAGALADLGGSGEPHVRVMFAIGSVSQAVYAIDPESARHLASTLVRAADKVDQACATARTGDPK